MNTLTSPKTILVGQRVHCILNGGKDGVVTEIHGEQSPENCKENGSFVMGGRATFDIIWDKGTMSQKIPESLLLKSVQWRVYDEYWTADQIAASMANLATETANRAAEESLLKAKFDAEVAELRDSKEWACLDQANSKNAYGGTRVAKQIRIGLKKLFPGVKFGVRSDYSSVNIGWEDGPTIAEVDVFVQMFRNSRFNSMDDSTSSVTTPWNTVFGGCQYVITSRAISDMAINEATDLLFNCQELAGNLKYLDRPDIKSIQSNNTRMIVGLDLSISEAIKAIAYARNMSTRTFPEIGFNRRQWLLDLIK